MRAWIWLAVACGSGGPPQVWRSPAWIRPCGWPVRWLQPDAAEVAAQFDRVVAALEGKLPAAAAHLPDARDDLLAFTAAPREIWR